MPFVPVFWCFPAAPYHCRSSRYRIFRFLLPRLQWLYLKNNHFYLLRISTSQIPFSETECHEYNPEQSRSAFQSRFDNRLWQPWRWHHAWNKNRRSSRLCRRCLYVRHQDVGEEGVWPPSDLTGWQFLHLYV